MGFLAAVSLIWAFSFGLIGRYLTGLDAQAVAFMRLLISFALFLPFLRPAGLRGRQMLRLALIGAVQYGVMYSVYIESFRFLAGHEVALLTITTPLFVTLLDAVRRGRFRGAFFAASVLAVAGSAVLTGGTRYGHGVWPGVLMIQLSNICFAAGQVEYRLFYEREKPLGKDWQHFGFLYLGAAAMTALMAVGKLSGFRPAPAQWAVLLYLGILPSALGFFLWNLGARRVNAGILAVFNNVKIPLAVLISLVVFSEPVQVWRLVAGAAAIAAGFVVARRRR